MSIEAPESTRKEQKPLGVAAPMADAPIPFPNWDHRSNNNEEMCHIMQQDAYYTEQILDQGKTLHLPQLKKILEAVTDFSNFAPEDTKVNEILKGQARIEEAIKKVNNDEEEQHVVLKAQLDELSKKSEQKPTWANVVRARGCFL